MAANNVAPSGLDKEQMLGMVEKEMEYRVELFNKMTQTCFNKCVDNRYKESELNMGENSCIDRCVSKYWHVYSNTKGSSSKSGGLEIDDDMEEQHRSALHKNNYQSSGAEDDMSD